jgi:hypothetical protein
MEFLIILMIPVVALCIGWLYGRNQVDPFGSQAKTYYDPHKEE